MSDMKVLIINAVITFVSFFVAAPVLLNAMSRSACRRPLPR